MQKRLYLALCAALIITGLTVQPVTTQAALRQAQATQTKAELKPDVAALLKQATDAYKKMKTYRHTAKWNISGKGADGAAFKEDLSFTLALERPNKFAYKLDTKSEFFPPVAAFSDGVTFVNLRSKFNTNPPMQYIKAKAPASFQGINIVDDVEFQPIGTYVVALMLQGDALADKDVRAAMEKASIKPTVTENGKKWQVLEMPFGEEASPYLLYFGADDHLLGKAVLHADTNITETIENIKVDKPVDASAFQYVLPADAKQVDKFSSPQRPNDARRNPPHRTLTSALR